MSKRVFTRCRLRCRLCRCRIKGRTCIWRHHNVCSHSSGRGDSYCGVWRPSACNAHSPAQARRSGSLAAVDRRKSCYICCGGCEPMEAREASFPWVPIFCAGKFVTHVNAAAVRVVLIRHTKYTLLLASVNQLLARSRGRCHDCPDSMQHTLPSPAALLSGDNACSQVQRIAFSPFPRILLSSSCTSSSPCRLNLK